jgi:hypothetical protein
VPSAGSNDNGVSLVRVERQAVQKKPVIDRFAAIRKRCAAPFRRSMQCRVEYHPHIANG